jgi:hypothetical protein
VQPDALDQGNVEPGERLGLAQRRRPNSGSPERWRRSTIRPWRTTTVSPGSTRLMPAKMVSRPVANCICKSSLRTDGTRCGVTIPASSSAPGADAKAKARAVSA